MVQPPFSVAEALLVSRYLLYIYEHHVDMEWHLFADLKQQAVSFTRLELNFLLYFIISVTFLRNVF